MALNEFGNGAEKVAGYREFWQRAPRKRPLVGFTCTGWFPVRYFAESRKWKPGRTLSPEAIFPERWLDDHERLLAEDSGADDDILRGAAPTQVAVPFFLPAALGCPLVVLPDSVMAMERKLSLDEALEVPFDAGNPWIGKYLEYVDVLVARAGGRYPVSHNAELGPSDLHGLLREQRNSILDTLEAPEKTARLLFQLGDYFQKLFKWVWARIPKYYGGYFDSQYQLWAPGPICRMQEDVSNLFSPALFEEFIAPVDRMIAQQFECAFIHLHATSMFLLSRFLEIREIACYQLNIEPLQIPLRGMLPFFQMVQQAERPLIIRGSFTADECRWLRDSLDPRGLYLHIIVTEKREIDRLRSPLGM